MFQQYIIEEYEIAWEGRKEHSSVGDYLTNAMIAAVLAGGFAAAGKLNSSMGPRAMPGVVAEGAEALGRYFKRLGAVARNRS